MIDRVGEGSGKTNLWFSLSDFLTLKQPYYPAKSPWLVTGDQNLKLLEEWRSDLHRAALSGRSADIIRVLISFREEPIRGRSQLVPHKTFLEMLKLSDPDLIAVYLASKGKPSLNALSQSLQREAERRAFEVAFDFERIRLIGSFDLEPNGHLLLDAMFESIEAGNVEGTVRALSLLNGEQALRDHAVFLWSVLQISG